MRPKNKLETAFSVSAATAESRWKNRGTKLLGSTVNCAPSKIASGTPLGRPDASQRKETAAI
jgi:hypothetical protein